MVLTVEADETYILACVQIQKDLVALLGLHETCALDAEKKFDLSLIFRI